MIGNCMLSKRCVNFHKITNEWLRHFGGDYLKTIVSSIAPKH